MYDVIKTVIDSKLYELSDMINKITTIWLQGQITEEQKTELIEMAQKNATVENSYAPLQNQVNELFKRLEELEQTVNTNAQGMNAIKTAVEKLGGLIDTPQTEPVEEYPDWVAWNGVGTIPWQNGSKCTHNGDRWISHVDNNIWEPGAIGVYDNVWEKVK